LAVLDLVHRSVITAPFITGTGDLVELNELFNLYWRRIIPLGQTSSIAFPFSRLDREPFCGIYRASKGRSGAAGRAGDNGMGV
jgi:putative restriction endonuclease